MKKQALKYLALALCTVMFLSMVIACGGGNEPTASTSDATIDTTPASATKADDVITTIAPTVTTEDPALTTAEQIVTTTQASIITTTEPVVTTTEKPIVTTTEPVVTTTEKPIVTTSEPVITTTEPTVTTTAEPQQEPEPVPQYTITFNSNGGSSVNPITADSGSEIKAPSEPKLDGYVFVCWCSDPALKNPVTWPYKLNGNVTFYASYNEKIDMIGYLKTALTALSQSPYDYIPEAMRPTYQANLVEQSDVAYDFTQNVNVSSIRYGGFGEQWHMVIDNITQSELFYNVLNIGDDLLSASVIAFNNWFDSNPASANKEIDETGYYAKVEFKDGVLSYTLRYKSTRSLPIIGTVTPEIMLTYNVDDNVKTVRIQLTESNVCRYEVAENEYSFAIQYGVDGVNRTAKCELIREIEEEEAEVITGHIYEFITALGKDAIKSCADFYITEDYVSVVGNKAGGMIGFDGYINELYLADEGKLLGYKVMETKEIAGIEATWHTLWFNLNDIFGITSVKAVPNGSVKPNENPHDIYVNGSASIFEPTYNYKVIVKTSRKYDIEMRTQYFYGYDEDEKLVEYVCTIPMMFIQDGDNFADFEDDIKDMSDISASVKIDGDDLEKIRADYEEYIPTFIDNKDNTTSQTIREWIG